MWLLLPPVTLGIYFLYWYYKTVLTFVFGLCVFYYQSQLNRLWAQQGT